MCAAAAPTNSQEMLLQICLWKRGEEVEEAPGSLTAMHHEKQEETEKSTAAHIFSSQ